MAGARGSDAGVALNAEVISLERLDLEDSPAL
jgi:hypothetical protein